MSRTRFQILRKYLHFNDNSQLIPRNQDGYDKCFKIRPFIKEIQNNMQKLEMEERVCVDELIIPFKGRSSLKQYIKSKPHKWGIKALAGSSGIVYDFKIYAGKQTNPTPSELGISGDIVLQLAKNIPKFQNHKLFCDNYFSSIALAKQLKEKGIFMVGTIRSNRLKDCKLKCDKDFKKEGRGSYVYKVDKKENIIIVKWYDNKFVHIISTLVGVHPVVNVKRWSLSNKEYIEVPRPNVLKYIMKVWEESIYTICLLNAIE
ncbi:piggyBac transposable element-derived protein 3-like [Gordionus sp. m RMFG-2023]|uniref:piggyBac transposable element-derived protein 3-like n=1 Tax=Gordionus sp. m RMFG-2023 TaxID=3053472 RepID=UPI0031FCD48C